MLIKRNVIMLLSFLLFTQQVIAKEVLPLSAINFTSPASLNLFKKDLTSNSLKLLAHFTTQKTLTYCGIASAVMVLNSTDTMPPLDPDHISYPYFTQDNFFNENVIKIITPAEVKKEGISLIKLSKAIESYGLKTHIFFGNQLTLDEFRKALQTALLNQHFIIINFARTALKQNGGGHHSPIAAYDKDTDRFLILDVARYKYSAGWIKTQALWEGVNTVKNGTSRGFIIINP